MPITAAMPTNEMALSANTQPAPTHATTRPPIAGPTARATFMFRPLSAAAWGSNERSTRSGWIACHAGAATALPQPRTNVSSRTHAGDVMPRNVPTARAVAAVNIASCAPRSRRRRSTRSAHAPAGSARSTIGRLEAVCTSDTSSGELSINNHCAPTVCIQVPTFDANCAIHNARNIANASGAHADAAPEPAFRSPLTPFRVPAPTARPTLLPLGKKAQKRHRIAIVRPCAPPSPPTMCSPPSAERWTP